MNATVRRWIAMLLLLCCLGAAPALSTADLEAAEQEAAASQEAQTTPAVCDAVSSRLGHAFWLEHAFATRLLEADIFRPPIG